jgi:hypothetical protein
MRRLTALSLPAALTGVGLLAGCVQPGPTLDQRLSTFINRPEGELIAQLGVPTRSYDADGRRFLQFESQSTVLAPMDPYPYYPSYGPWGMRRPWMNSPNYVVVRCDMTFALRQGVVESFSFRGEGCG